MLLTSLFLLHSCAKENAAENNLSDKDIETRSSNSPYSQEAYFAGLDGIDVTSVENRLNQVYADGYLTYEEVETTTTKIEVTVSDPYDIDAEEADQIYLMALEEIIDHVENSTLANKKTNFFDLYLEAILGNTLKINVTTGVGSFIPNLPPLTAKSFHDDYHYILGLCDGNGNSIGTDWGPFLMGQYATYNRNNLSYTQDPNDRYIFQNIDRYDLVPESNFTSIENLDQFGWNSWHNGQPNFDFVMDFKTFHFDCAYTQNPNDPWFCENFFDFQGNNTPLKNDLDCIEESEMNLYLSNMDDIINNAEVETTKTFLTIETLTDFFGGNLVGMRGTLRVAEKIQIFTEPNTLPDPDCCM